MEPMATRKSSEKFLEIASKLQILLGDLLIWLVLIIQKLKIIKLLNLENLMEIIFIMELENMPCVE